MRSLAADKALAALPIVAVIGTGAGAGHWLLSQFVHSIGGWFTASMVFLPVYAGLGWALASPVVGFVAPRLHYGTFPLKDGRRDIIGLGGLAAVIGLAVQPSIFVAIAATTFGAVSAMKDEQGPEPTNAIS